MKTQKPVLTAAEIKYILSGVNYGVLSRDELEHALSVFNFPVEQDDRDVDLVGYLQLCLEER